jgi:hypothetical protein
MWSTDVTATSLGSFFADTSSEDHSFDPSARCPTIIGDTVMMKYISLLLVAIGLFSSIQSANAVLTTYQLDNVVFTDGGTASGYIQVDLANDKLGAYDFITTSGITTVPTLGGTNVIFQGSEYDNANDSGSSDSSNDSLQFEDNISSLTFYFSQPLADNGNFLIDSTSVEIQALNGIISVDNRFVTTGALDASTTSLVPEPSSKLSISISSFILFFLIASKVRRRSF